MFLPKVSSSFSSLRCFLSMVAKVNGPALNFVNFSIPPFLNCLIPILGSAIVSITIKINRQQSSRYPDSREELLDA